jgi:hypothetical protein
VINAPAPACRARARAAGPGASGSVFLAACERDIAVERRGRRDAHACPLPVLGGRRAGNTSPRPAPPPIARLLELAYTFRGRLTRPIAFAADLALQLPYPIVPVVDPCPPGHRSSANAPYLWVVTDRRPERTTTLVGTQGIAT